MLLGEPPRSQADLNFRVLGIPVRIHPMFWVVSFMLGISGMRDAEGQVQPQLMVVWVIAVFLSILIHELGHALTARYFGNRPWITLYAFGGLASYDAAHETPRTRIPIVAAGPGAGFVLAALIVAIIASTGHFYGLEWSGIFVNFKPYNVSPWLNWFIFFLLYVNIWWGLINLLPVYPLDGGQISRELFVERDPYFGMRNSLILSIVAAGAIVIYAITRRDVFLAIMFAWLAYSSYTTLQSYSGRGGGGRW